MKNNKAENLREKLKQALTSTARVISDDIHLKTIDEKNKKDLNFVEIEKNTIAEYYQRCFGEELPESLANIQI